MQRVRMILPYLGQAGVTTEVLAVEAEQVAAPQDPWLLEGLPKEIPIHRVRALGLRWTKIPGLGTLSFRAKSALERKGNKLLKDGKFDLVYFSTTQFGTHLVGPAWKETFKVPFVMDYQDPWVSDYYRSHPEVVPPGGRLKYAVVDRLNRLFEPKVLKACSGFTSVSPDYPEQIANRYSYQLPSLTLPFPGDEGDIKRVAQSDISQRVFDPKDGFSHWVYVGRGGADMAFASRAFFRALKDHPDSDKIRVHFIGTSYAAAGAGQKTIAPLAAEFGLEKVVEESPDRIPYSETLRCLLDADALIVPGSDDPAYTASKIYPYLLVDRPMLAIFHQNSSVSSLMKKVGGGSLVSFHEDSSGETLAEEIRTTFEENASLAKVDLDLAAFAPYHAKHQAQMLAQFFQKCLP